MSRKTRRKQLFTPDSDYNKAAAKEKTGRSLSRKEMKLVARVDRWPRRKGR